MSTVIGNQLFPAVEAFLSEGKFPAFVGGRNFIPQSNTTIETLDPGSGQKLGDLYELSAADINQAVEVADQAFPAWAKLSVEQRSAILLR